VQFTLPAPGSELRPAVLDQGRGSGSPCELAATLRWAVPLRDAIGAAGGFRISDGFISPLDLVEIGLVTAEEAEALHAADSAAPAS
jgi:hypothetical protein